MSVYVDSTAVVDDGVEIGDGSRIWHFCHICTGAKIGNNCTLGQNVYIGPGVSIGSGVKIQNNVSVYAGVTLEDDVFCGPSVVFTNVTNPRANVDRSGEFAKTVVCQGASIGANATIVCGNSIGRYSFIGAGAVVTNSVVDYALVLGVPASQVGWVSRFGNKLDLPLSGHYEATCPVSGCRYSLSETGLVEL